MMNGAFTQWLPHALLIALALLLVRVVVSDLKSHTISNRLNLTIAALAPVYWLAIGLPLWPEVAIQVALAVGVFLAFAIIFYLGGMGGGDVKLAAALALWFPPLAMLQLTIVMSIAGGILTLIVLFVRRGKDRKGPREVPYGVAIAVGAWAILAQRYLNHFA